MATVLHTSDSHLDLQTYGRSRAPDHERVLAEIVAIAREVRPDLVVHTGDLFDTVRPSTDAMHRAVAWLQELAALSAAGVIVTCGNHESPSLFRLFARILGPEARVRFVDRARLPEDGGIIDLPGPRGQRIRVAPLPFVHANRVLDEAVFTDASTWTGTYADRIRRVEQILGQGLAHGYQPATDVLLFAAHLHVAGAHFGNTGERPLHLSEIYGTTLETLPAVNYAAFGHIHTPQQLPGSTVSGAYAGSPIQTDFGEEGQEKSVVIVEAEPQTPTRIHRRSLTGGRRLLRLSGTIEEIRRLAPAVGDALCLVTVRTETHVADLAAQVRELLPAATLLQVGEECGDLQLRALTREDTAGDAEPGFVELFHDYLVQRGTKAGSADRVLKHFETLIAAVDGEVPPEFPEEAFLAGGAVEVERIRPGGGA